MQWLEEWTITIIIWSFEREKERWCGESGRDYSPLYQAVSQRYGQSGLAWHLSYTGRDFTRVDYHNTVQLVSANTGETISPVCRRDTNGYITLFFYWGLRRKRLQITCLGIIILCYTSSISDWGGILVFKFRPFLYVLC